MKKIILLVGGSGTGKDLVANIMHNEHTIRKIVSYTTRPIRDGEMNGREHYFLPKISNNHYKETVEDIFAYTLYGENEYFTTVSQINEMLTLNDEVIYIIDEAGVEHIKESGNSLNLDVVLINITRDVARRLRSGVSNERMERDSSRIKSKIVYDYVINNNGTIDALKKRIGDIVKSIRKNGR